MLTPAPIRRSLRTVSPTPADVERCCVLLLVAALTYRGQCRGSGGAAALRTSHAPVEAPLLFRIKRLDPLRNFRKVFRFRRKRPGPA
jgi:hypothetical protein